jgi:hypothetical protein
VWQHRHGDFGGTGAALRRLGLSLSKTADLDEMA